MSMSFDDFDIEILACNSARIATPLLEVESGFRMFIVRLRTIFKSCVKRVALTLGVSLACLIFTKD